MENTTTALILAGDGYNLTIAPEAEARKLTLLKASGGISAVTTNDESADAQVHSRRLAQMRIEVEKCRKEVKEPVNRIGKLIDQSAKDFVASIELEEKRITRLVGDHAQEVARIQAEKLREEHRAFEAARLAKAASEAEARAADAAAAEAEEAAARAEAASVNRQSISEIVAARKAQAEAEAARLAAQQAAEAAERERQESLAEKLAASEAVAETSIAQGVRFVWDFEVTDISSLVMIQRLVTIEPRRAEILSLLKKTAEEGKDVVAIAKTIGLHAFQKPVVSSR
jgi:hypothetical protein